MRPLLLIKTVMCALVFALAVTVPLSSGLQNLWSEQSIPSYGSVQYFPQRLRTESRWIKDSDGNIVRLKGAAESMWFQDSSDPLGKPYNEESKFKARWSFFTSTRANFLRFGIDRTLWYNYPDYRSQLDTAISWLKECGVKYIVLDNHETQEPDKMAAIFDGRVKEFLVELAQRYKDEPVIIGFDFCNEPPYTSDLTVWDNYRSAIISAVRAIHAVDPNYLVFFEPLGSSTEVMQYFYDNPITEPNIVYGFHIYFHWDTGSDYTEAYREGDFETGYQLMEQRYQMAFKMMGKGYPVANMETGAYKLQETCERWDKDISLDNLLKAYNAELKLHEEHGVSIAWIGFAEQDYKGTSKLRTLLETGTTLTEIGEIWAEHMA